MYGESETSRAPRWSWVVLHLGLVLMAGWIYRGPGLTALPTWIPHPAAPGDPARRLLLFATGVLLWLRMSFTALYLLQRRFGWGEMVPVTAATALYQVGFALLGAGTRTPLSWLDAPGILLVLLGSALNTGSELQRKRFKDDPANRGRLFTGGLFRLARHVNFFGDTLWALGWALLTRNAWALLIPLLLAVGFVWFQIPILSRYLAGRYGNAYREWAGRSKRFIPFVY
jgi:protein-S-isoprenylcysteine O-methyltransferase Ste14